MPNNVRLVGWSGYDQGLQAVFDRFEAETGIGIDFVGFPNQDVMLAEVRSMAATGNWPDVASPTTDRLVSWAEAGLLQPFDDAVIGVHRIDPRFHDGNATVIDGQRMGSPNLWGSAGIGFRSDEVELVDGEACLLDLFDDRFAGRLAMREDTAFVAAGRALDTIGGLPRPFAESYVHEQSMVENYDRILAFLLSRRDHVARYWFSEEEGQDAYRRGGCVIGYSWDTSIRALQNEHLPVRFVAPIEGAACYLQNFVLLRGAENTDAANAWVAWVNTPAGGAAYARAFGAFSPVTGSSDHMDTDDHRFALEAYPESALDRLWWQPVQPPWFAARREAYASAYRLANGL